MALVLAFAFVAQQSGPPKPGTVTPQVGERIAWYATWDLAKAEAARTKKPILLLAAAPHCHNISGLW
jgi:hypothetical protein